MTHDGDDDDDGNDGDGGHGCDDDEKHQHPDHKVDFFPADAVAKRYRPWPKGLRADFFFFVARLSASMARSLHLSFICIPQSTRALDQGGVEPRQAVSPRPGGQGRYRFATASA